METNEIVIVGVLYIVSLMLFLFYLYEKYRTEGYIFSICNAYIFQYAVILFLITPFAFTPKAWIKLLGNSAYMYASNYYPYLLKSLKINCFGFIFFIATLLKFEFSKKTPKFARRRMNNSGRYSVDSFLNLEFLVALAIWIIYSIFILKGFSLFGSTGTSENGTIYYINQAMQVIITIMTLYYGFCYINRKRHLKLLITGIVACVLMGKRATLVMDILWGMVVYILYRKAIFSRKVFNKSIKYAIVLIIIALLIGNVRSSSGDFTLLENLVYGNTFCDIRDGGLILYGFENNTNSEWAMGRTYLSALLSFIPSSFSEIRTKWDWGRYSTTTLLGWKNHPGLRGGWSMEGYLNFGLIGVIISQTMSAKVYSDMEKYFRMEMFGSGERRIPEKAMLSLYIFIILARRITCSSGFFAEYVLILFVLFNNMIGRCIQKK